MSNSRATWVALVAAAGAAVAFAGDLKIELPKETATLKPGPRADLASGECLICHSAEYITTQPRDKPLAFWKAEVEKMKKVYGAPIPDDQVEAVAEYLARSYGTGSP
jgi:sulfite dehydrogenase (cytochrome) subunit B